MAKKAKASWFKRLTSNKFEVTLFEKGPDGVQFEDKMELSKITKITKHHIKGYDMQGNRVEYFSNEPFNYYVVQFY